MGKIFENIDNMIKDAMKASESDKVKTYRAIKAKFLEFKTAKNAKPLDDAAEITIIKKMVKERQDSIDIYQKNNRLDLAEDEIKELNCLTPLLPQEASAEDINKVILQYVEENGEFEKKQMGLVVKYVKSNLSNADGGLIAKQINAYLSL